ncbi:MAG TPA: AAA family ATPase [Candidatus Paceibacterota bacterium]|nr:AAA family ATPase [Candidatus Paceibacterota bacterium]
MKRRIITISGVPGSGKSSAAAGIARALGYEHFSSGDLFRKMAAERGISIEEMNLVAEKQREIDHGVDELLVTLGKEKDDFVIDSRTAFHWIPASFRVFLELDPAIAARRTFAQIREEGRVSQAGSSLEQVLENTLRRIESEKKRFRDLYQIDFTDVKNYDLVVDTGANDLEKVIGIVIRAYRAWLAAPEA